MEEVAGALPLSDSDAGRAVAGWFSDFDRKRAEACERHAAEAERDGEPGYARQFNLRKLAWLAKARGRDGLAARLIAKIRGEKGARCAG